MSIELMTPLATSRVLATSRTTGSIRVAGAQLTRDRAAWHAAAVGAKAIPPSRGVPR
jgi:hypothetical protein